MRWRWMSGAAAAALSFLLSPCKFVFCRHLGMGWAPWFFASVGTHSALVFATWVDFNNFLTRFLLVRVSREK